MTGREIIIWSGGCDSTLVLAERAVISSKKNPVHTLSFNTPWIDKRQMRCEFLARKKILKELKKRGLHIINHEITLTENQGLNFHHELPQQHFWWLQSMFYAQENDNFYFGYIREDDWWHVVKHYESMLINLRNLWRNNLKIHYPLEWTSKHQVVRNLKKEDLLSLCWVCEDPKKIGVPCRKCKKCLELKDAIKKSEEEEVETTKKRK